MPDRICKIVDSNYLRTPNLRAYLEDNKENFVVINDYASMEAYKGDTLITIRRSMETLSQFPEQVIILKGTKKICGLRGRSAGLQRRMIDRNETRDFPSFCRLLGSSTQGNSIIERQLLQRGRWAEDHMGKLLVDAANFPSIFENVAATYGIGEVARLRRNDLTEPLFKKLISNIIQLSGYLFRDHLKNIPAPNLTEVPNLYIFRFAIMVHLLALKWIEKGGAHGTKPERLRNDLVDIHFATYATYFDGLLSNDQKTNELYSEGCALLSSVFQRTG